MSLADDTVFPIDVLRFYWERVRIDTGLTMVDLGEAYHDLHQGLPTTDWRGDLRDAAVTLGASSSGWNTAAATHGVDQ